MTLFLTVKSMKVQRKIVRMPKKDYYQYSITIPPKFVIHGKLEGKDLSWQLNKQGRLELVEK